MPKIEQFPSPKREGDPQPGRKNSTDVNVDNAVEVLDAATTRRSADQIFTIVEKNARAELERTTRALAFSGLAGGLTMGLTGLGVATARAQLGPGALTDFISLLFYPLGFVAVIIGRAQLFTENTLYPVALILSERKHLLNTLRLWTVVFITNMIGAALFAALAVKTGSLRPDIADKLVTLGQNAVAGEFAHIFWSGVIGGWIIALMAWIVSASHWTIGQIAIVYLLTVVVGMGHFAHCIASSGEILSSVWSGLTSPSTFLWWLTAATLGNVTGGVVFVTLLNFGQVNDEHQPQEVEQ